MPRLFNQKGSPRYRIGEAGVVDPKIIIGGIIVAVIVFLLTSGSLKFNASIKSSNLPASTNVATEETKQEEATPVAKPKTYQNEAKGITLEYPASWSLKENPAEGYIAALFTPKKDGSDDYIESLGIKAVETTSQPDVTLQELADVWENQTKAAESTFVVLDRKSSTIAGEDAKEITYTFKDKDNNGKGMTRVTLKNKRAYIFQYNALENTYDKYLPDIEKILDSVKF